MDGQNARLLFDNSTLKPRESGAYIAENSEDVRIVAEGIKKVAVKVTVPNVLKMKKKKNVRKAVHPTFEDNISAVNWCFMVSAINFSFWLAPPFKQLHQGRVFTGYMAFCAVINELLGTGVAITTPSAILSMTYDEFSAHLRSNCGQELSMMRIRWEILQECCQTLVDKFGGTFYNCLKACDNSATKLLDIILDNFPSFHDVAMFNGRKVSFMKRAQILVSDVYHCLKRQEPAAFTDIDQLTMFADYRVPQVLRHFDALRYSPALKYLLVQRHMFTPGERLEIEIRGCAIEAVERILSEARRMLREDGVENDLNSALIDYFLWTYCAKNKKKIHNVPPHRIRSIFY